MSEKNILIPQFDEFGHLPVGGHECTWEEFYERFRINNHREELCNKLVELVRLAKNCGFLGVLIGGSFPTAKDNPDDMDLAWVTDFEVTKATVKPECVQLMEDRATTVNYGWSMQYLPIDHDHERIQQWAKAFGYCSKTKRDRGMLVLAL
ncbi:MAG TPA: hypothetical protein VMH04_06695 [Candidatus Solibacter sp.]|nr:hypothetical protein [Candidatus Solibacter sp.]